MKIWENLNKSFPYRDTFFIIKGLSKLALKKSISDCRVLKRSSGGKSNERDKIGFGDIEGLKGNKWINKVKEGK